MVAYLIGVGANPKILKSDAGGEYLTGILNLYPGAPNVCAWATQGCIEACLHTAGNPVYQAGKERARKERLEMFQSSRRLFLARLRMDVTKLVIRANRLGVKPCVRLNGTSDITWERIDPQLFRDFSEVQFYDYTKGSHRLEPTWVLPSNYDLTFSYSGENWESCERVLSHGGRVAMVFGGVRRKDSFSGLSYRGWPIVDGDTTDLTFTRPSGSILGLRAKGRAKHDTSGFVVYDIEQN